METQFEDEKQEQQHRMEDISELDTQANSEIEHIKADFENHKDEVIEYLLKSVKSVSLQVQRVVKSKFE